MTSLETLTKMADGDGQVCLRNVDESWTSDFVNAMKNVNRKKWVRQWHNTYIQKLASNNRWDPPSGRNSSWGPQHFLGKVFPVPSHVFHLDMFPFFVKYVINRLLHVYFNIRPDIIPRPISALGWRLGADMGVPALYNQKYQTGCQNWLRTSMPGGTSVFD